MTERQSRDRQPRDWAVNRTAFGTIDAKFVEPHDSIESRAEQRAARLQNDVVAWVLHLTGPKYPTAAALVTDAGVGLSESALRRVMRGEAPIQLATATALGIVAERELLCGPREYQGLQVEHQRLKAEMERLLERNRVLRAHIVKHGLKVPPP